MAAMVSEKARLYRMLSIIFVF